MQLMLYCGVLLVGLVLVQALLATADAAHRFVHARRQRQTEADLLAARVGGIREALAAEEQRSYTWNGWRKFEIRRRVTEDARDEVCSFYLAPHDGRSIPAFEAGQFLTFQLKIPGETKPVVRCYSISDAPQRDRFRVSIKRVPAPRDNPDVPPGQGSNFFHDNLFVGDIVDVKAPTGGFYLDLTKTSAVVLACGGVGITPVLSMLNAIVRSGRRMETWFFYGVRNKCEHIMKDHLEQLAADFDHVHLHVCYSNPREEDEEGADYQHAGRVSVELMKSLLPSNNFDYYICGPPPMMNSLVQDLEDWNVPQDKVHIEKFGGGTRKQKKELSKSGDGPPITFHKSGKTVNWDAGAEHLWEFANANDIHIDSGCLEGNCGSCITAIRSGEVEYIKQPDAEYESGSCLVCCCVPKGPLELDA
jgi:hypothetical protein